MVCQSSAKIVVYTKANSQTLDIKLSNPLVLNGYRQRKNYYSLFIKKQGYDIVIMLVYADDYYE